MSFHIVPPQENSYENFPPQAAYFYHEYWTEPAIDMFVNVLMQDTERGQWNVDATNYHCINQAIDIVNICMGTRLTWNEAIAQRNLLEKRYKTFKLILEVEGAWYDRKFDHVNVPVWSEVFKVEEFAKAFYHRGDPMFDKLESLFSKDHDRSTETINVSSFSEEFIH